MSKRVTKAQRILNDSMMRLEAAQIEEQTAQSRLNLARGVRMALEGGHLALEKELVPQPRKASKRPATTAPTQKESATGKEPTGGECAKRIGESTCTLPRENPLHNDRVYADYHDFEGPKSVARAPRKSRQRPEATSSVQSLETVTESAGNVVHAADGGG